MIRLMLFWIIFFLWIFNLSTVNAIDYFKRTEIMTERQSDAIIDVWVDPLKWWTNKISEQIDIAKADTSTTQASRNSTLTFIRRIADYLLSLLWFVALLFILYHWFLSVTAGWNEEKFKKGMQWIVYSFIALVWIWFSWLLISLIYVIINQWDPATHTKSMELHKPKEQQWD